VQLLERADGVLFLSDARSSLTSADMEAADWLRGNLRGSSHLRIHPPSSGDASSRTPHPPEVRQTPIPVIVIANKCDNLGNSQLVATGLEAVSLGLGNPVLYSAETQAGTADLYEALQTVIDAAEKKLLHAAVAPGVHALSPVVVVL
jgi:predicted GTPase